MDTSAWQDEMILGSLQQLRDTTTSIRKHVWIVGWRFYNPSMYSWVYGLSDVRLEEFITRYSGIQEELKGMIARIDDPALNKRVLQEYRNLPDLDLNELIAPQGSILAPSMWFRFGKKVRRTYRFWQDSDVIIRSAQSMIDSFEGKAWIALEQETPSTTAQ
jgi:hypothetical protein